MNFFMNASVFASVKEVIFCPPLLLSLDWISQKVLSNGAV